MRLYNIYYVCKMAMEDLKYVEVNDYTEDVGRIGRVCIENIHNYKSALEKLEQIDFIRNDVQRAIRSIADLIVYDENVSVIDDIDRADEVISTHDIIENKVQSIIDLYESMKDTKQQVGIDIFIPPCQYLNEYLSILKEIDFIISQCPYLKSDDEDIRYNGTDIGSDWITLVIVTTGAVATTSYILNNFAELTKKVQDIMVRLQKIEQNKEFLKTMKIKNELLEQMKNAYEREIEETYQNAKNELKESLGNLNDGEEEGKVLLSLQKYKALLDRGVQFYSSIESPPEIKELLPSSGNHIALSDTITNRYLESKDDKN